MDLCNRKDIFLIANRIHLEIKHFAKGVYEVSRSDCLTLPVNRFFCVLSSQGGNLFMEDATIRRKFEPGNLYFIPSDHPVHMELDKRIYFLSIQFNLEYLAGLDLFHGWNRTEVIRGSELLSFADKFESPDRLQLALELKAAVFRQIVSLIANSGRNPMESVLKFAPYEPVLNYLERNCRADVKITDLAETMKMSRSSFSRHFAEDTGMTAKHFFDLQLIRKVQMLLGNRHITVREVSAKFHFSSEYVFSRFFKKHIGMSPGEFQKKICF